MTETKSSLTAEDLISLSLQTGKAIADDDKKRWNEIVEHILQKKGTIIALRGAGSVNGMDPDEIKALITTELIPRIRKAQESGQPVTVLFDGDSDSPEKPDIGYVAGRLRDAFGDSDEGVTFITAQKQSWYYPKEDGGNLTNATDKPYATYVFDDGRYPGDHNAFTQDERLIESPSYEQWYIGPSGPIADSQVQDFNDKVPHGQQRKATFFRVRNNQALDQGIRDKLSQAQASSNSAAVQKLQGQLAQRERIYGVHFDTEGNPILQQDQYPNLEISFV